MGKGGGLRGVAETKGRSGMSGGCCRQINTRDSHFHNQLWSGRGRSDRRGELQMKEGWEAGLSFTMK